MLSQWLPGHHRDAVVLWLSVFEKTPLRLVVGFPVSVKGTTAVASHKDRGLTRYPKTRQEQRNGGFSQPEITGYCVNSFTMEDSCWNKQKKDNVGDTEIMKVEENLNPPSSRLSNSYTPTQSVSMNEGDCMVAWRREHWKQNIKHHCSSHFRGFVRAILLRPVTAGTIADETPFCYYFRTNHPLALLLSGEDRTPVLIIMQSSLTLVSLKKSKSPMSGNLACHYETNQLRHFLWAYKCKLIE